MPGKHIYVREIKLHCLTFINTAIIITSGTEGVLSTLVANGTGTVSTIVANGSERVNSDNLILINVDIVLFASYVLYVYIDFNYMVMLVVN